MIRILARIEISANENAQNLGQNVNYPLLKAFFVFYLRIPGTQK